MHQEPAHELIDALIHGLPGIGGFAVILITEVHTLVIPGFNPDVGNGSVVRISGEIRYCVIGTLIFCHRCCFSRTGESGLISTFQSALQQEFSSSFQT